MKNLQDIITNYENIFVTSDLHFYHKNIFKYEPRRLDTIKFSKFEYITHKLSELSYITPDTEKIEYSKYNIEYLTESIGSSFTTLWKSLEEEYYNQIVFEHRDFLIDLYNQTVGKNDLCLILGDFSLAHASQTNELLGMLNGNKILLKGNHDNFLNESTFDESLVLDVRDYLEFIYKDTLVVLMHYPILHFKKQDYGHSVHLFGHIHSSTIHIPYHSYHVGIDTNGYKPVRLDKAIKLALEEESSLLRYYEEEM